MRGRFLVLATTVIGGGVSAGLTGNPVPGLILGGLAGIAVVVLLGVRRLMALQGELKRANEHLRRRAD